MTAAKKQRRAMRQQLLRQAEQGLNTMLHGSRPAQVKAAARTHVDQLMKRIGVRNAICS